MKKFNEYKERVFKIRVVSAPAGAWYESLVGSEVETSGYNRYDQANEWRVNDNGSERLIAHNDCRVILRGGFARWSTVLISGKRWGKAQDQVATLTGENLYGNLQVNYITGGSGVCNPEDVTQVLDEGKCFDESSAYQVAKFYDQWKSNQYLVCPHCKSTFEFYTFSDKKTLKCNACQNEDKGEKGIRLDDKLFTSGVITLTDEDIRKHNSKVLYKHFKEMFIRNGAGLDLSKAVGWISETAPEGMMESGAEIKDHYDLLGEERVQELREIFKTCYSNTLTLLKKRAEERKERESWSELEKKVGRKIAK